MSGIERYTTPGAARYMPQLDGLRAIAVGGVLLAHFKPIVADWVETGWLGVELFFVLSGYLITSILLRGRDRVESGGATVGGFLRSFYVRRALRLYPALFAALALSYAAGLPEVRHAIWWHLSYLSDVYFARRNAWDGATSHLWSLAVEEQFYLVWPLVILLVPRRHLIPVLLAVICSAPVTRLILHASPIAETVLPFAHVDTLGLGGLLALSELEPGHRITRERLVSAGGWVGFPIAAIGLVGVAVARQLHSPTLELTWDTIAHGALGLAFVCVVAGAARGFDGWPGSLLAHPRLVSVGVMSYGVYLYHNFIVRLADTARALGPAVLMHVPGSAMKLGLTLGAAWLSWHFYERPINRWRDRLDRPRRHALPQAAPTESAAGPLSAVPPLGSGLPQRMAPEFNEK